ncbi:MAG: arsenite methyltransferase [Armatimonadetes bacterium]|nr:arsenite methyltransferase [Armatimonadota bacterium]
MSNCCNNDTNERDSIKAFVKMKYGQIATNAKYNKRASCCASNACADAITQGLYDEAETKDIPTEALLASLGCGNPVALAQLNPGEVVLDLGSGGGIDVLLSARRVGPTGKAYGLDMTDEMLELARQNQQAAGIDNVEFLKGNIENIPLPDNTVDVIISNCVINLSTDKDRVFAEAFRVLKPGGRLAVADIVLTRPVDDVVRKNLALWAGCIAGALEMNEYKEKLKAAGFANPEIEIVRTYQAHDAEGIIPPEVITELGEKGIEELTSAFVSAFIRATKPEKEAKQ